MTAKPPIGPDTKLCMSLAGRPGHFGSRFHNYLYEKLGLDFLYKAFTTQDLLSAIGGVRALGIRGCAISMPFKEAVIPMLNKLDDSAAAIQSVNTIVNDDGFLTGFNTDYSAVVTLLERSGLSPETPFLLRGSGGMAKAVAGALHNTGFRNGTIIARNKKTGPALATMYGFKYEPLADGLTAPLLINVTPLGMKGADEAAFAFPEEAIYECDAVFDVVAMPIDTPMMRLAAHEHKKCISGADVAVLQAVEQFALYTGIWPEPELIVKAATYARG